MRITKTTERWFPVPNDPDKARLKIKHLSPGETQDIFDKVFTQKIDYKKGKGKKAKLEPIFSQKTDKGLDRKMTLTMVVVDWENFFDEEGKKLLECTSENIMEFSRKTEGFTEFVTECREQLAEDIENEKEEQIKNSKGSVSAQAK